MGAVRVTVHEEYLEIQGDGLDPVRFDVDSDGDLRIQELDNDEAQIYFIEPGDVPELIAWLQETFPQEQPEPEWGRTDLEVGQRVNLRGASIYGFGLAGRVGVVEGIYRDLDDGPTDNYVVKVDGDRIGNRVVPFANVRPIKESEQ
jgi:hypothetical protein